MNIEEIEKNIRRLATFRIYGQVCVRLDQVLEEIKEG